MSKIVEQVALFNTLAGNIPKVRNMDEPLPKMYEELIREEYCEFTKAISERDEVEIVDACADMIVVIMGYLLSRGYDPVTVMDEVNLSNLSKFCTSEEEATATVGSYADDHRYVNVHYVKKGNLYVVRGSIEGVEGYKILKSVNTKQADFKSICDQLNVHSKNLEEGN